MDGSGATNVWNEVMQIKHQGQTHQILALSGRSGEPAVFFDARTGEPIGSVSFRRRRGEPGDTFITERPHPEMKNCLQGVLAEDNTAISFIVTNLMTDRELFFSIRKGNPETGGMINKINLVAADQTRIIDSDESAGGREMILSSKNATGDPAVTVAEDEKRQGGPKGTYVFIQFVPIRPMGVGVNGGGADAIDAVEDWSDGCWQCKRVICRPVRQLKKEDKWNPPNWPASLGGGSQSWGRGGGGSADWMRFNLGPDHRSGVTPAAPRNNSWGGGGGWGTGSGGGSGGDSFGSPATGGGFSFGPDPTQGGFGSSGGGGSISGASFGGFGDNAAAESDYELASFHAVEPEMPLASAASGGDGGVAGGGFNFESAGFGRAEQNRRIGEVAFAGHMSHGDRVHVRGLEVEREVGWHEASPFARLCLSIILPESGAIARLRPHDHADLVADGLEAFQNLLNHKKASFFDRLAIKYDPEIECAICLEMPPNVLLSTCGHTGICSGCYMSLKDHSHIPGKVVRCPLCRTVAVSALII